MKMVMIPKPGKDHTRVKGWRPIVLAQCVGKLGEKVIAQKLQEETRLFHHLQYGSRTGRSAIDALMLTKQLAEESILRPDQRLNHATSLGKDIVSAYNNANKSEILRAIAKHLPHLRDYVDRFLGERTFEIQWDNEFRGMARTNRWTPQGSPLSPVLWCISMAAPLARADRRIAHLPRLGPLGRRPHLPPLPPPESLVLLFSYVDDVNPLIVSKNTTTKQHNQMVRKVNQILNEEAERSHLTWKESRLDYKRTTRIRSLVRLQSRDPVRNLGVTLDTNLRMQQHIRGRLNLGRQAAGALRSLCNSQGGVPPNTMRKFYCNMIRPILTYGSELYLNCKITTALRKLEYQILRSVTGGYHGSSHRALSAIAGIEPIHQHLKHKARLWIGRQTSQPDPLIKPLLLQASPDSTRGAALHIVTKHPKRLSFGSRTPSKVAALKLQVNLHPEHPKVEDKLAWMRTIKANNPSATTIYTDGSGAENKAVGGAITDRGATTWGEIHPSKSTYLGKMASVADEERTGIANALQLHPNTREITILTDSLTALTTAMNLSKGHPPRSRIEKAISTHLYRRHQAGFTTSISWVKGHVGVPGNEAVDKLVGKESSKGSGARSSHKKASGRTPEGSWKSTGPEKGSGKTATNGATKRSQPTPGADRTKGPNATGFTKSEKSPTLIVRSVGKRRQGNT